MVRFQTGWHIKLAWSGVVGGVVGFTLVGTKASCINWAFKGGVGGIVASWVLSPALAGLLGVGLFHLTRERILRSAAPREKALKYVALLFAGTTWLIVMLCLMKSPPTKKLPLWADLLLGMLAAGVCWAVAHFYGKPWIIARLPSNMPDTDEDQTGETRERKTSLDEIEHSELAQDDTGVQEIGEWCIENEQ